MALNGTFSGLGDTSMVLNLDSSMQIVYPSYSKLHHVSTEKLELRISLYSSSLTYRFKIYLSSRSTNCPLNTRVKSLPILEHIQNFEFCIALCGFFDEHIKAK